MNSLVTAIAALGFIAVPVVHAQSGGSGTGTNRGGTGSGTTGTGTGTGTGAGTGTTGTGTDTNRGGIGTGTSNGSGTGTETNRGGTGTETNRVPLKTEVTETFVEGYTVPIQYRTYFTEFPEIKENNVVVRYHKGRAFYLNSNDWKVVRIVDLDTSAKRDIEDAALVEGSMIPENLRTSFIEVPKPEAKQSVRFYNDTAYYMDEDFRIVRTVRLMR